MTPWRPSVVSDDLLLEEVIPAWAWQVCAVAAVGFACAAGVALNSAPALPGKSQTHTMLAVGGFVLAGLCAAGAAYFFKIRNNRWVYFNDRVEVYRGDGDPAHAVSYADVQRVVYGLQPDGKCEFLMFYGPDPKLKFTLNALWLDGRPNSRATLRSNKLRALRDRLNGIVAARMCAEAAAGGRPRWFDEVYITANGLVADGQLAPWTRVKINANDKTGKVIVVAGARSYDTSMVQYNVVAGLQAVERLRSAPAAQGTAAAA